MGFRKEQIEALSQELDRGSIRTRKGAGNMQLSYIESHYAISKANEIFGYDGWSYEIVGMDSRDVGGKMIVTARVRVTVHPPGEHSWASMGVNENGIPESRYLHSETVIVRSDVGHGTAVTKGRDGGDIAPDFEKAEKEAVSDALKRALRTFGDQFGNCLYDKEYLNGGGEVEEAPRTKYSSEKSFSPSPNKAASEKQIGFLNKLLASSGKTLKDFKIEGTVEKLSSAVAGELITKLQAR